MDVLRHKQEGKQAEEKIFPVKEHSLKCADAGYPNRKVDVCGGHDGTRSETTNDQNT